MNLRHASTATYLAAALSILAGLLAPVRADDNVRIQEEVWALPLPLPMFAYVVRPVRDGPFPLAIMNHGVSLKPVDRSFFPLVEFRDAAKWFAKRGYLVVAPVGTGFGAAAIDIPEHGVYGPFFSKVGNSTNPNFHDAGRTVAKADLWPAWSKRMHDAFTAAGGSAEYHLMPPFGNDGRFFIDSPDTIPMWSPLLEKFLDAQK